MELLVSSIDQVPLEIGQMAAKVFLEQQKNSEKVKIEQKVVLTSQLLIRKSSSKLES